jgi:enamine deaminase RidA (YjgF/YER057c/UK114 family)
MRALAMPLEIGYLACRPIRSTFSRSKDLSMSFETVVTASGRFMYDNFHFSEATKSNGFLLCSGVLGTGEKGKLPDDIKQEFRNAWEGIGRLLAACALGYDDIVECTSYHVGLQANMGDFMSVRDEFLSEPWPAWTAIGITELAVPGAHVEIRVTAKLKTDL